MDRIPLPNTDTALLVLPRWGALLLLYLMPAALVLWLYRYELRLVARTTASLLLLLRLVVLFLVLSLVLLQPVIGRTITEELPGRVLIAVDRSDSMDVTDPQRPVLDKLRLARALHLAPAEQLDAWIHSYEAKVPPNWFEPDESGGDPERRRRLAEERRQLYDNVVQQVDALTRTQLGKRLLARDGLRLLDTIASRHKIELLGFAQDAWDVKPDRLEELFQPLHAPPGRDGAADAKPERISAYTDLRLPLEQALKRSGQDQGKVLGVVLLTDGQHNWGQSPVKKAIELGEHKLPIYPVGLGAKQPPPDIALVNVKAQPAVFKDVDMPVEARFKITGLPAQDVVVELQRPGEAPLEEHIRHDGTDRYYTVRYQVRMEKVGTQSLTVIAKPVPGETRTDNNGRPVVVNVADDKARVLLIDGEARWEFHYLASALLRDRGMDLQSVVFNQPRLGRIAEEDLRKLGNPAKVLPDGPDALAGCDCIILGDVTPEQLPTVERARLEKYVGDRGGTLVVLAGKRAMPLAFTEGVAEEDPLFKMLPIEQPHAVHPVQGFPVTLTQEGKLTTFLQMDPAPDQSETRWAEFPPHYWGVVGKAKPGATALAYLKEGDDPEHEQALIVRHHYGFGRVLFVGIDSTWRWRYKVGDTYHHRFWGQAIHWAAADKPLVAGNDSVRFGTSEPVVKQGQEVEVVVRLAENVGPLPPDALAGARILKQRDGGKEEAVALVPLSRREAQPRVLEGRVRDLLPGAYQIELAIPELADKLHGPAGADGQPGKMRATFTVSAPEGEEMVELATNWPLLEELAAKSGGKVFTVESAPELVELLNQQSITHTLHSEFRLWQSAGMLAVFLVLLTVEWGARKLAGLP